MRPEIAMDMSWPAGTTIGAIIRDIEATSGRKFRHTVTIIPRADIQECPPFIQVIAAENDRAAERLDEAFTPED